MADKLKKLSECEVNQLKALESYQMIHSAREVLLDQITWLASKICNVLTANINLKGHGYRWGKSYQNSGLSLEFKETDFSTYALVSNDVFEVSDTTQDPRFCDKPIVTGEPKILFYAGVPLINHEGDQLGTLSIFDQKSHKLNPKQREVLKKLAEMVVTLLETKEIILMDMQQIKNVEQSITESNQKLQATLLNQQKYNGNMTLLEEMSGVLQACLSYEEAYQVIAQYCQKIFPKVKGYLYFIDANRKFLELVTHFGFKDIEDKDKAFLLSECWGLRLGGPHQYCVKAESQNTLLCKHAYHKSRSIASYSCLPLSSQGDIFGLLYLECSQCEDKNDDKSEDEVNLIFRKTFAEQIALSISNLKLRTTLQKQSITDPLTGLFNRRYYYENINWLLHKNSLSKEYLAFVMIDIDLFKNFNDTYGHDAGDMVLIKMTELIRKFAREGDIVCRMGGEEFLFLTHDVSQDNIKENLESLRRAVESTVIIYRDQTLPPPSISVGVAFVDKACTAEAESLLIETDKALYMSKEAGRNRITYHVLCK